MPAKNKTSEAEETSFFDDLVGALNEGIEWAKNERSLRVIIIAQGDMTRKETEEVLRVQKSA